MDGLFSFLPETGIVMNFWLWQFLGRLHPLIVHFPIGLLVMALVLELFTLNKKNKELRSAINLLLIIGALSAIAAVIFGLLLKTQDQYSGDVLTIHQWSGIATAILAATTTMLHRLIIMHNTRHLLKTYRTILIFTVLGVTIAGHYGASLTHGSDFLSSALPWNNASRNSNFDITQLSSDGTAPVLNVKQIADLNLDVRSIFAHNCYKCHSSEKIKGELRLDKKVFVMKGGKSGDVISPGHPEESEMIRRLLLPREDEESMPPKGKTLSEKEISTLKLWIKIGAPWPESADEKSVYRVAELEPRMPGLPPEQTGLKNPVDLFVNEYFKEKKISWPTLVDDRIYIRRVYLDIIGLLPPPEKVEAFVKENNPDKRIGLVEE
ncbi:MAG TPA: c-type cytochrome domain-containing protein, partial [Chryseolinea sp.]|nr:c-type cytochrome domain-containing protein [Chryseolinea sp.]